MASDPIQLEEPSAAPRGRPPKWQPEFAEEAGKLAMLGYNQQEMADHFGVDEITFWRWRRKKPSLRKALACAGALADAEVAVSLHQRAVGFTRTTTRMGKSGQLYEAEEYYPPDVAAASLWLRNRQGAKWRDKTDVQHSGTISLEAWVLEATPPAKLEQARVIDQGEAIEHQPKPE